jgi:hypothetical protein
VIQRVTHAHTAALGERPLPGALSRVLAAVLQGVGAAALAIGSGFSEGLTATGRAPTVPPRQH